MNEDENSENRFFHLPVLVESVVQFLVTDPDGIYVDGTLGGGGHCEAVIKHLSRRGGVIGIDRDNEAVSFCRDRFAVCGERIRIVQGDLSNIDDILFGFDIKKVDGFFLDLGVSSYQIDTPSRGFSYLSDGPLDMRMNRGATLTAETVVNTYSESNLSDLFYHYGEERYARKIAQQIIRARVKNPICLTGELAALVRKGVPFQYQIKTLSRIWQALRFEVNDELNQLKESLVKMYSCLKPGGRMVIISWESLMDRMVKRFFKGLQPSFNRQDTVDSDVQYHFKKLTRKVVRPSADEVQRNSRARSARLRAAEKIRNESAGDNVRDI